MAPEEPTASPGGGAAAGTPASLASVPQPRREELAHIRARLSAVSDPTALLEGIVAFAPVGIQIYGADGHCLVTNAAFRELFGSEPPPEYNVLEDELAREAGMLDLIHRAFAGETISTPPMWYDPRELRQVRITAGRRAAIAATFFPLRDADSIVKHVAIVFKDVTAELAAKEAAEARQREAEAQRNLRDAIIDHSGDGIIVSDPDGVIRIFNPAAARQHGVEKMAVSAPDWAATFGLLNVERAPLSAEETPLYRAVRGEKVADARWIVRRPDGTERWLVGTASPIQNPDGSPGGAVLITRDETERLALEAELKHSEARFRSVFDSPMLGIGFWNHTGEVTDANDRLLAMLGYSRAELGQGMVNWRLATPPEYADADRTALEQLASARVMVPFEKEYVRRDGSRIPVLIGGATLPGFADRGVFFALDVSEQVRARREIERLVGELNEAVKARDDFLLIAGHELRTPLTALQLQVQSLQRVLARAESPPAGLTERLRAVDRHVARLEALISELLNVSRITAGRMQLYPESFDMVELLRDVAERLGPHISAAKCTLRLEVPRSIVGEWDRARIEQVLTNIISNAVKYGSGKPIDIEAQAREDRARVVIRDYGIGIAPRDQQRVFERFERAVSERHYGGLGLGLWIARQVIEAHGGSIECSSVPGEGTAFVFDLPLSPAPRAAQGEREPGAAQNRAR